MDIISKTVSKKKNTLMKVVTMMITISKSSVIISVMHLEVQNVTNLQKCSIALSPQS